MIQNARLSHVMRPKLRAFSRYRQRLLTLALLAVIAAMIVLSNLTYDGGSYQEDFFQVSYGWPLIWHRYVGFRNATVDWHYSAGRLAANSSIWFVMLALPGLTLEWLLRRYPPRLQCSLRTMLLTVAIAAVGCAWFSATRRRADIQDALVAHVEDSARFSRWGPRWLDLLGVDRFRRHIVRLDQLTLYAANGEDERLLRGLAQLSHLRDLSLTTDRMTPALTHALKRMQQLRRFELDLQPEADEAWSTPLPVLPPLGNMRHLKTLTLRGVTIDEQSLRGLTGLRSLTLDLWTRFDDDDGLRRNRLAAIGNVVQLEHLDLSARVVDSGDLAFLGGFRNLKTLRFDCFDTDPVFFLSHLPPLPNLESLNVDSSVFLREQAERFRRAAELESLRMNTAQFRSAKMGVAVVGLPQLASLEHLAELQIDGQAVTPATFDALRALKRLRTLRLSLPSLGARLPSGLTIGRNSEVVVLDDGGFCRAIEALRQSNPGITIDWGGIGIRALDEDEIEPSDDTLASRIK